MNDTSPRPDAENTDTEGTVLTPTGRRLGRMVHPVRPGEAVRRNEGGALEIISVSTADKAQLATQQERAMIMAAEMVLTPGGYKPKSQVHRIEPKHVLDGHRGRYSKVNPSGNVIEDYGVNVKKPGLKPLMPANVNSSPGITSASAESIPLLGSGWIAYAGWSNDTGTPISLLSTTWIVPPEPATQNGQTIFLFNGIQNSTMIYQPVLQWGSSAAGGDSHWAVASWYADSQTGHSFFSTLVDVNVGDELVGVMTMTNQTAGEFSYYCEFSGIANTGLPIQNVDELTWCVQTLEAYGITACSDYPDTEATSMTKIALQAAGIHPNLIWATVDAVTDCGQHAHSPDAGQVDLFY